MSHGRFLREYWQKRPLLIRAAFPQFHNVMTADDLAGLACESGALARIVAHKRVRSKSPGFAAGTVRDRWIVRNGPFKERVFARLPRSDWTLLVQDVDKWDAGVAALLDQFVFLPAWRIDDVMVSYAVDGGGVGAHVDNYDVFLVQTSGRRRWRISIDPQAPKDFRDDVELKLLRRFEPTHEWTLEPGDALYLPPGVPHDGVAIGACITCSVGMRAPSIAEMIVDFAESVAEPLDEAQRYVDRDLAEVRETHEISADAIGRARHALAGLRDPGNDIFRSWFGRFITRYRSSHEAVARARALSQKSIAARLDKSRLVRNPWSRTAWSLGASDAELFVAGESYHCSPAFARLLAGSRTIDGKRVKDVAQAGDWPVLARLVNDGHFVLSATR